jgi:phenylacetate-coenzyme A ligase PaaK-like adenylate-forming protein
LAEDICLYDQQACSSPQCVFVEGSFEDASLWASKLGVQLDKNEKQPLEPSPMESAEISRVKHTLFVEGALRPTKVIENKNNSWRLLVDSQAVLRASPLYRSLWVMPVNRKNISESLRPFRKYLQSAGLSCSNAEQAELLSKLSGAGVLRFRPLGKMHAPYSGEPHDGVYALQRFMNKISHAFEPGNEKVTHIQQLMPYTFTSSSSEAIMDKSAFQEAAATCTGAELYFKSGGSSGDPKISTFSYNDYHDQMKAAAEGLIAAGLDPSKDLSANLFYGGGLYGGFLSFFTILENMNAPHLPMAAHGDLKFVAESILKYKVNSLLGMPSYIWQLFTLQSETLKVARIEKIFFGGEHFSKPQREILEKEFGVKLIRSATYGSVDAGPIGYQCAFCEGSVHHLHSRLQDLEILAVGEDTPVSEGRVGRLVLSSKKRTTIKLSRYEIGDLGRWKTGECACGRLEPRFELLGRTGDIFRAAGSFLNYQKIQNILGEKAHYSGNLQVCLRSSPSCEVLVLRIEGQAHTERMKAALVESYSDLKEMVHEKTLAVEIELNPKWKYSDSSGKLIHIVDERQV